MNLSKSKNNPTPTFTIITATFNAGVLLPDTIQSVINQGISSVEWIVIDNCSTDNTEDIIKLNSQVIDKFISEPDSGIYDAWNKGIKIARGEWILFIGAGDILMPNALLEYEELLINNQLSGECNLVSSKAIIKGKNGSHDKVIGQPFERSGFRKYMTISHVGALHHKSLFDEFGEFSTGYRICSDYEFLLRCSCKITPLFMDKITINMLPGGVSDSYRALVETFKIHKIHHNITFSFYYLTVACLKLFLRKVLLN